MGVNIDMTPRVHHDGEVTLQLKLDISAVGAPGYQGLPTFNSRTVNSTIRLRDGETNMLAGLILDNERRGLTGIPGVASIPFFGKLFAKNKDESTQTDIVMTLTPHVIRRSDILERDLRSFLVGGEASPFLFEVPPPSASLARRPPRARPSRRASSRSGRRPPRTAPPPRPAVAARKRAGPRVAGSRSSSDLGGDRQLLDLHLADSVLLDVHDRVAAARRLDHLAALGDAAELAPA